MRTVDRIQDILNKKGISAAKMMRDLGFSSGLFSQWKTGKQKPSLSKLEMIADYLGVTITELRFDELKENAIEKFGFCWDYTEREKATANSRKLINSGTLNTEETVKNAVIIFKALFSRSLEEYHFSLSHVNFETYVAMLLNQDFWKNEYSPEVYNELVRLYGTREGINEGTYYIAPKHTKEKATALNLDEKNNISKTEREVKLIARKTKDLPEEEREALLKLLNSTVDTFLKAKGINND